MCIYIERERIHVQKGGRDVASYGLRLQGVVDVESFATIFGIWKVKGVSERLRAFSSQ